MATLRFSFQIDNLAVPADLLVVRSFEGQESLSDSEFEGRMCAGFCYDIELACRRENILPEDVVDSWAHLSVYRDGELTHRVHGVVRRFTQGDVGHHHTFYSVRLVPALERLSLRHNSRIFQGQSSQAIITTLLQEMGLTDFAFSLKREASPREFCAQYRETDLAFVQRLAAEEGWVYHFEHEVGKHTLIFSDRSELLPTLDRPIPYHSTAGGDAPESSISSFSLQTQTNVSELSLKDYSFKKPQYSFLQAQTPVDTTYERLDYEHFDAPGRYKDDANGKTFSQARLAYLRRDSHLAAGNSTHGALRAGYRFALSEHPNEEWNRVWLVVRVRHHGEQAQALEEDASQGITTYHNQFDAIPATQTWQATPQAKPQVDGPMMATVVGPEGEEIYCDKSGRVKLHFPWDRYSDGDEHSSCWVQVAQGWAGGQYGMMALPRIGHEVIVSFLNGDPDQPIVTGRTFNALNTPPYPLPDNKTKMVIRSETHQGDGFNELSFEDQVDNELIYLKAQKDMQVFIGNSQQEQVNYNRKLDIGNDEEHVVANDRTVTVEGSQSRSTQGDERIEVGGNKHQNIAGDWASKIQGAIGINANGDITLKSTSKITLQVGGSFVVVDSSSVAIDGTKVLLKSGGSPGSLPLPSSPTILTAAASDGSAFVSECETAS